MKVVTTGASVAVTLEAVRVVAVPVATVTAAMEAAVAAVREAAEVTGCFKCILDCAEANVPFYEKCGFKRKEICMALYLDK